MKKAKPEIIIRKAQEVDIEWVNSKYAEIEFKKSNFEHELITIAECEGMPCGLGRLIKIDDKNYELGGMYVFQEFRYKGIAQEIVEFLIHSENLDHKNIWCLPFEHLESFYTKFGFRRAEIFTIQTPKEIEEKLYWCNNTYDMNVLLLVKENGFADSPKENL